MSFRPGPEGYHPGDSGCCCVCNGFGTVIEYYGFRDHIQVTETCLRCEGSGMEPYDLAPEPASGDTPEQPRKIAAVIFIAAALTAAAIIGVVVWSVVT